MRARFVDFHCHLDLYPDHRALIAACDAKGVATLAVTTTPKAWEGNQEAAKGSTHVKVALGLHPQLVESRGDELDLLLSLLPHTRYVGEVGLDASPRHYRSLADQERVFVRVLQACAEAGGKILTVHSVRTARRVLDLVEKHLPPERGRVVLHWFSGTAAEARRAVDLGCFFSVNVGMFSSARGIAVTASLPIDRILTETDGPFVDFEGEPLKPGQVEPVLMRLAGETEDGFEAVRLRVLQTCAQLLA